MPQPLNWSPDLSQPQPGSDAALALGWSWPAAREAADNHKRGSFAMSWQLWLDMDSLPAIRAAKNRRLASPCGLPWVVTGPTRAPARFETEAAQALWNEHVRRLLRSTLADVVGMGFSVWQHPTAINPVTLRREVITVERWPISQVRFTATPFPDVWNHGKWINRYYAIQFGVGESLGATMYGPQSPPGLGAIPVPETAYIGTERGRHGVWIKFIQLPRPGETDGHWTLLGEGDMPHMNGAVTALDVSYVGGAILTRSGFNLGKNLGRQSPVIEMPEGMQVDGPEGKAAERTVQALGTTTSAAVLPGGAKMTAFSLVTQTAGMFTDFADRVIRDVELAILGHAGAMAKQDAQYQSKDGVELKVPQHLERADVKTIEAGFNAVANLLAEQNAPSPGPIALVGKLPDTEQDERMAAEQDRRAADDAHRAAMLAAGKAAAEQLDAERAAKMVVDDARVAEVYAIAGLPPPRLPPDVPAKQPEIFAYDLEGGVLTRGTAAALKGLPPPPFPDETVPEFRARLAAQGQPAATGATAEPKPSTDAA